MHASEASSGGAVRRKHRKKVFGLRKRRRRARIQLYLQMARRKHSTLDKFTAVKRITIALNLRLSVTQHNNTIKYR